MKKIGHINLFVVLLFIALFISYHIYYSFIDDTSQNVVNKLDEEKISTIKVEKIIKQENNQIIGFIEIPKINLKRGFYNINSKENNVNKNITILKGSNMPNRSNSSLFLAAHSGNSLVSYFKNLDKLILGDEIIIYYNNIKYHYSVFNIYELEKNGKITVNKNIHDNILVLTTCSKNENKQLIVKAKLINKI